VLTSGASTISPSCSLPPETCSSTVGCRGVPKRSLYGDEIQPMGVTSIGPLSFANCEV
jgi:hypothetical protein